MKLRELLSFFFFFLLCTTAQARKTDLSENHWGLLFGVGTYPFSDPSGSDALSQMAPLGVTVSGSNNSYLIPLRMGLFFERTPFTAEFYYKFITNSGSTWGTTGTMEGAGKSSFRSQGYGSQVVLNVHNSGAFKFGVLGSFEFVNQRVDHQFTPTGLDTQKLTLTHTTTTLGVGLQGNVWLGDLWVLTSNLLYYYGTPSAWKVARPDSFFGRSWDKGNLTNPQSGEKVNASFSGILFELGLKLNFYSL